MSRTVVVTVLFLVLLVDFIRRFRMGRAVTRQYHPLPDREFFARDRGLRGRLLAASTTHSDPSLTSHTVQLQQSPDLRVDASKIEDGFSTTPPLGASGPILDGDQRIMSRKGVCVVVMMLLSTTLLIVIRCVAPDLSALTTGE
jgi:hypothetical protein